MKPWMAMLLSTLLLSGCQSINQNHTYFELTPSPVNASIAGVWVGLFQGTVVAVPQYYLIQPSGIGTYCLEKGNQSALRNFKIQQRDNQLSMVFVDGQIALDTAALEQGQLQATIDGGLTGVVKSQWQKITFEEIEPHCRRLLTEYVK